MSVEIIGQDKLIKEVFLLSNFQAISSTTLNVLGEI